jgi:hypothetical protein
MVFRSWVESSNRESLGWANCGGRGGLAGAYTQALIGRTATPPAVTSTAGNGIVIRDGRIESGVSTGDAVYVLVR